MVYTVETWYGKGPLTRPQDGKYNILRNEHDHQQFLK